MNHLYINSIQIKWDNIDQDSYVRDIEAFQDINQLDFHSPVTFFVGENGSGKSTLLEAIAIAYGFNPEGGSKNYHFSTHDSHSELCHAIKIIRNYDKVGWGYFLRAESFYNVASQEEEYARIGLIQSEQYHELSHGESFLKVIQNNTKTEGLYIFDEPEAALSPQRQLTLLREIDLCVKDGAQFIITTHSPILLGMPNSEILCFDDGPIHPIGYEECSSYQVTELFINHKDQVLRRLLSDDE